MNAKLLEIIFGRIAKSQLSGKESNLGMASCQGGPALQRWLAEGVAPTLEGRVARTETGSGKSSSRAEALELLLTGRSARWDHLRSIWKSAGRNLTQPVQKKIVAEFVNKVLQSSCRRDEP